MDVHASLAPHRPLVALAVCDPAGISLELTAKLLTHNEVLSAARLVVIADRRVLEQGAVVAGVALEMEEVGDAGVRTSGELPAFLQGGTARSHHDPARRRRGRGRCLRVSVEGSAWARLGRLLMTVWNRRLPA